MQVVPPEPLAGQPVSSHSENFCVNMGKIFVVISPSTFSEFFVEVFSLYPIPGPEINPDHYINIPLSTSAGTLSVFTRACRKKPRHPALWRQKGNVGCAVDKDTLKRDVIECCGKRYIVKGVMGGGRADEVNGGRDLVVMETVFDFNSCKVRAQVCPPMIVKASIAISQGPS